jgi:hypothetical protein
VTEKRHRKSVVIRVDFDSGSERCGTLRSLKYETRLMNAQNFDCRGESLLTANFTPHGGALASAAVVYADGARLPSKRSAREKLAEASQPTNGVKGVTWREALLTGGSWLGPVVSVEKRSRHWALI